MYEFYNDNKFDSIEVTLSIGCKLDCYYCPQKILLAKYFVSDKNRCVHMTLDSFKQILTKVKHGGTICFSGMCEPFHNPHCADMIVYAYKKGFRISLLTTLIGLKKEDIEKLKDVNFDNITLHIPDEEENSKFNITDEYLENLELFHKKFKVSDYSCHGTLHSRVEPYINRDLMLSRSMMDRAGNLDCGKPSSHKGKIVCMVGTIGSYGNWTPEILPDGTVLLCCMDYSMKHILGNILTMSVSEILNSKEYTFVKNGMKDDSLDILCRKCSGAMQINNTPAYRFLDKIKDFSSGNYEGLTQKEKNILNLFYKSDNICVFGLGKLFWNNFFNHLWNDVLGHKYYSDNNTELWGKKFSGVECISPTQLSKLSNPLVITSIANDKEVRKQLDELGVKNIINIMELYDIFGHNKAVSK